MISIFNQTYKYTYKIKHIQALTTPSRQETQHAPSLPRDHGSEVPVEGVPVTEGCFKGGLPRGDATEAPVGRGVVAEDDVMTQLFGRWSCEEAAAAG